MENPAAITVRQRAAGWLRSWPARDVLAPYLVTRAMLVVVGWLALQAFQGSDPGPNAWQLNRSGKVMPANRTISTAQPLVNMWARWDAGWYYSVAKDGYKFVAGQQSNAAFFPTYPLAMRAFYALLPGRTALTWYVSGLLVSNLALLAALIYLVRLVRLDGNRETAARSALYLLAFPTTLFLSSIFTESMFILFTVLAFYQARRERWWLAGAFGGLSVLTRSPGILLCAPLAVEYLAQRQFQFRKIRADVIGIALLPAALGGLMLFFYFRFGNMFAIRDAQAAWGGGWGAFRGPWYPIVEMMQRPMAGRDWVDLAFGLLALGMSVCAAVRLRLSYGVYALVCALFLTSWGSFESMPRYVLIIFPVFVLFAQWGRNELFHRAYLIVGSGLAALFMIEFALWRWVA